jgi:hypothetical protein
MIIKDYGFVRSGMGEWEKKLSSKALAPEFNSYEHMNW